MLCTATVEHPAFFELFCDLPEMKPVNGIGYGKRKKPLVGEHGGYRQQPQRWKTRLPVDKFQGVAKAPEAVRIERIHEQDFHCSSPWTSRGILNKIYSLFTFPRSLTVGVLQADKSLVEDWITFSIVSRTFSTKSSAFLES